MWSQTSYHYISFANFKDACPADMSTLNPHLMIVQFLQWSQLLINLMHDTRHPPLPFSPCMNYQVNHKLTLLFALFKGYCKNWTRELSFLAIVVVLEGIIIENFKVVRLWRSTSPRTLRVSTLCVYTTICITLCVSYKS